MRLILRRWLSTSLPHTHKLASLRRDVLKKIHPDLFAMSPDAQQTNLACVQGLTDFWSVLSNLMTCIQPGASANTSTISHIKDKYTLSCYVRPNIPSWTEEDEDNNAAAVNTSPSTTEEPKELIHVSYIISVIPKAYSAISQRQPIPKDLLVTTTHSLIFQQSVSAKCRGYNYYVINPCPL